jgi:hypothetical protein
MARLAVLLALLTQLEPALASFYTVTSYYALSTSLSKWVDTCTSECRYYTSTETLTVNPTVTPTATPVSRSTYTYSYDDLEVVRVFVPATAVASSDLVTTTSGSAYTSEDGIYTQYAVAVTWTAPSSCPTPFTVATYTDVYIPRRVTGYITATSTATSKYTYHATPSTVTYITYIIPATAVPTTAIGNPTSNYYYSYYVADCVNPTASRSSSSDDDNGYYGGSGDYDDDDWMVCAAWTGSCVALATWVIVVATVLPTIFLLGFVESYCWFRRMMLGKSALRLGTVCWCCLSLWFILLTRKAPARSPEDQVLLRQYWASLSAGTRIKYWFKYGFGWRYPVELLGNPDGNNPVVVVAPAPGSGPAPQYPGPGNTMGDAAEKVQGQVNTTIPQQQPPVYMYPGVPYPQQQQQQQPGQYPYPGQPGFAPYQQGYGMPVQPPQAAYMGLAHPGVAPSPPPPSHGQQQMYPGPVSTPSPVQPTPPPQQEYHQPPPGHEPPQQPRN